MKLKEMNATDLERLRKNRKKLDIKIAKIDAKFAEHYTPLIAKHKANKDVEALESLLIECPDCYVNLMIYKALRDVKK